jgi:citrate lyase subunit beta/citryl-CoA lyase
MDIPYHRPAGNAGAGIMVEISAIQAPLFVPANRPDRFCKAAQSGTDAVILDLEDAVSAAEKDAAREALNLGFTELPIIIRINAVDTRQHDADVAAVSRLRPSAVMLPKAEDPERVAAFARRLNDIAIIALVETAEGIACARQIAVTSGVVRLAFGSVDYCADLACEHLREVLLPVRAELVLASRLAGIAAPIDGVTVQLDDLSISEGDAIHARTLGMSGKLCIHPKQIDTVKQAFAPSNAEIEWAYRVLRSGDGAIAVDGAMVDEPVRIRARAILRLTGGSATAP